MTRAGLGWLQGTVRGADPEKVQALVASTVAESAEARPGGTRWYSESATVGEAILLAWSPRKQPDRAEVYFEVRQTALDELGAEGSLGLARVLVDAGAKFTRADVYLDDRGRRATPGDVAAAFRARHVLTHVRRIRTIEEFVQGEDGAVLDGSTTYLGSPKSLGMIRVYDKAAESHRADAGVRWEYQARDDHAERFVVGALMAGEQLGAYVLGCICQLVDFRERVRDEHADRAPRLGWWASLLGDAERVSLTGPARVDSLERRASWLARQVAPSLALTTRAYGTGWLRELLAEGDRRLTDEHRRLLPGSKRPRVLP
jgi:DNA relaxase NicK